MISNLKSRRWAEEGSGLGRAAKRLNLRGSPSRDRTGSEALSSVWLYTTRVAGVAEWLSGQCCADPTPKNSIATISKDEHLISSKRFRLNVYVKKGSSGTNVYIYR